MHSKSQFHLKLQDLIQRMATVEVLLESRLSARSMVLRGKEMQIPYLLAQHCHEILLKESNFQSVIKKSFSPEFLEMLYTCALIPSVRRETPKLTTTADQELRQVGSLLRNATLEELMGQLAKTEGDEVSNKKQQVRQNRRQPPNQTEATLEPKSVSAGMSGLQSQSLFRGSSNTKQ